MTAQTMDQRLDEIEQALIPEERDVLLQLVRDAQQRMLSLVPAGKQLPHPFDVGEIRDEWLDQIVEAERAKVDNERRRAVLAELIRDANSRATNLFAAQTDRFLAAYQRELETMLDEVGSLAGELDGITNAEQALKRDRGPQWKRLAELADDYQTLRGRQHSHMTWELRKGAEPTLYENEAHASDLYIRNLDTLWPQWRNPQQHTYHLDGRQDRLEPWPVDRGPQLLLWLITSDAQPWIPTTRQLAALFKARRRTDPIPEANKTVINAPANGLSAV